MLIFNFIFISIFFIFIHVIFQRTPYDLIESESELVSGHDIEYIGSFFVFIFFFNYLLIFF